MSRFSHLEFGDKRRSQKTDGLGEPVRDQDFFAERAMTYWLAGDFEQALQNYSRALEKNSAFYPGWFGQVRMLIELREYPEARLWADKALELFPDHPELLAAKAVAFARDADVNKAQAFSDAAMTKKAVSSYVWLARAEVLLIRRRPAAENCLQNALSLAGEGSAVVRLNAGRVLLRHGHYSSATEYLRAAAQDLPRSALAWYELGRCQVRLGFPEADVSLKQSLLLHPGWAEADGALRRFRKRGLLGRLWSRLRRRRER